MAKRKDFGDIPDSGDIMKLGEVRGVKEPTLGSPTYEAKRLEARKVVKVARKQMTAEFKGWDKMLTKYESKVGKGESLTQVAKTLIESSMRLSQEAINNNLLVERILEIQGDDGLVSFMLGDCS